MNIYAKDGAQIVSVAKTLVCRKYFELNLKLFKVKMRAKKVVITFMAILLLMNLGKLHRMITYQVL